MHDGLTLLTEGVFREASWRWSRVRRPRTGFASLDPGGLRDSTWAPLRAPRQELADVQVANGLDEKRGPRTEIAAVERREARRSSTGNLREPEIGPTARRATRCGDPHQRRLGAPPPSPLEGELPQASERMRSREQWRLFENLIQ